MRIVVGNIMAIYRRELQGYFAAPLAYAIAGAFWFLSGLFFVLILQGALMQSSMLDMQRQQLGANAIPPFDVPSIVLQQFLGAMGFIVLVILPMLTMGLYAEERKQGTLELLATSPITNWAVALGKLLGVFTFFFTLLLPVLMYEAIALSGAEPPLPIAVFWIGHLGLLLVAAGILSLGMFISSLTASTILSAILTFVLVFFLWILDAVGRNASGPMAEVFGHLSLLRHFDNLSQGILETSALVLFASYIFLGIFLTAQSIEALRYQRS
ncbi:ABC transporter permease [Trichothermofontia sp.]